VLNIVALHKRLGPRQVLNEASVAHDQPGVYWIRGRNGSGKSTLVKCVTGVWRPDRGDVMVCGRSVVQDGRARVAIGYVPDAFSPFPDLTVREMLTLVAALKRCAMPTQDFVERFGVDTFLHQGVGRLSSGQARRASLLAACIGDPWLLVLDEPTTGLDVEGVALLIQLLRERLRAGKAALLVTHDVAFGEQVATDTHELVNGRLVAGGSSTGGP
jgi:ABC-type multidrug transport system ATPase subunit